MKSPANELIEHFSNRSNNHARIIYSIMTHELNVHDCMSFENSLRKRGMRRQGLVFEGLRWAGWGLEGASGPARPFGVGPLGAWLGDVPTLPLQKQIVLTSSELCKLASGRWVFRSIL